MSRILTEKNIFKSAYKGDSKLIIDLLKFALRALDDAGEKIPAAHVDMALAIYTAHLYECTANSIGRPRLVK